eukprot:8883601-Pyramimonas_sp.AAC.2
MPMPTTWAHNQRAASDGNPRCDFSPAHFAQPSCPRASVLLNYGSKARSQGASHINIHHSPPHSAMDMASSSGE